MSIQRKIIARLNRTSFVDNHVYTASHGPARGLKRQGGMGWLPSFIPRLHEWDAEEQFLSNLDWSGLTVFDVGGDQGLFTLFFARRVGAQGRVVVFEPNPHSLQRIEQNVRHNNFTNVQIMPVGLGDKNDTVRFTFPATEPARGTAISSIAAQIEHEASVTVCDIKVAPLDDAIDRHGLPAPDFIKLDVEGMEHPALLGMQTTLSIHRPRLSIEMHGADMDEKTANAERVVRLLDAMNYTMHHIETTQEITPANAATARQGHLYCEPQAIKHL